MTSSILADVARLLVQRAVLSAVFSLAGAFAGSASEIGASNLPSSGVAPGAFGPDFTPPTGYPQPGLAQASFAGGGTVRRSGSYRVNEGGAERMHLPAGTRVETAYESRSSGGDVIINVNGARDPVATAREVELMLARNGRLRRKVRNA